MRPSAEQFVAVLDVEGGVTLFFQLLELRAVGGEVGAEVCQAFGRFGLFGAVQLVAGEGGVVVEGAGEGGKGAADLAL